MAVLHAATLSPTKPEILAAWVPDQAWADGTSGELERIGAFRFDDPEGRVGVETFLLARGDVLFQVPLTYRDAPLEAADRHMICTLQHSALGTRWVYDALGDPVYLRLLAAATLTGVGQAVAMVEREGRWVLVPSEVRLSGGGWTGGAVAVDGFAPASNTADEAVLVNDGFTLRFARRPGRAIADAVALLAYVPERDEPVLLARIEGRPA